MGHYDDCREYDAAERKKTMQEHNEKVIKAIREAASGAIVMNGNNMSIFRSKIEEAIFWMNHE